MGALTLQTTIQCLDPPARGFAAGSRAAVWPLRHFCRFGSVAEEQYEVRRGASFVWKRYRVYCKRAGELRRLLSAWPKDTATGFIDVCRKPFSAGNRRVLVPCSNCCAIPSPVSVSCLPPRKWPVVSGVQGLVRFCGRF